MCTISAKIDSIRILNFSINSAYAIDKDCEIKKTEIEDGVFLTISFSTKDGLDLYLKEVENKGVKIDFL